MTNAGRIGIGLLLIIVGLMVWWGIDREDEPSEAGTVADRPADGEGPRDVVLRGTDRLPVVPPVAAEPAEVLPFGLTEQTLEVHGRVVDEVKRPVAGVAVVVRCEGAVLARGSTGDDGAFGLGVPIPDLAAPVGGLVVASDASGRMAFTSLHIRPNPRWPVRPGYDRGDVRTLELKGAQTLDVVVHADREATAPVRVRVDARETYVCGTGLLEQEVRLGEVATLGPLPEGVYRVTAVSAGFGRGQSGALLPREEEEPVQVRLAEEHEIEVTVLDAVDETPVEGGKIEVDEIVTWPSGNLLGTYAPHLDVPPTDEAGRTRIRGLNATEAYWILVHADGYETAVPGSASSSLAQLRPGASEVTLKLKRLGTLRWPIVDGGAGVPPDGSSVRLLASGHARHPLPEIAHVEDGHLVVRRLPPGSVSMLAVAADGSLAKFRTPWQGAEIQPITFTPPRALQVHLHYPDGAPGKGIDVAVSAGGYESIGGARSTDESGAVRFEGLLPAEASVMVALLPTPWGRRTAGTVDLEAGDGEFTFELQREREVVVHPRVAGKPALPPGYRLEIAGLSVRPVVDLESVLLRARWRPWKADEETSVILECGGYMPAVETLHASDEAPYVVHLDLVPAGSFAVAIAMPEDKRYTLQLQSWDDEARSWKNEQQNSGIVGGGQSLHIDPSGTARVEGLPAGRYRVVDTLSWLASEAVDIVPGRDAPTLRLDLSKSGYVKGTILGPDGEPTSHAGVRAPGEERDVPAPFLESGVSQAGEDGRFWFRVPGDRDVTLEAFHALHRPAKEGGRITLREPQEGVVLRVERGPTTQVLFDRDLASTGDFRHRERLRVNLYRGGVSGSPVLDVLAPFEGRTISFGGYEPGTYTVWIDACPAAPVVLEGVVLGDGETKLGPVATTDGATVLVRVIPKDGKEPPRVAVYAWSQDQPRYSRQARQAGREIRLSGLAPGKVQVSTFGSTGVGPRIQEDVVFEADEVVEFTLDFR